MNFIMVAFGMRDKCKALNSTERKREMLNLMEYLLAGIQYPMGTSSMSDIQWEPHQCPMPNVQYPMGTRVNVQCPMSSIQWEPHQCPMPNVKYPMRTRV